MDIICSSQMLVEPADTVVLLPASTRYEVPGGVTETSTERRVIFSPEIPGPRIGEARPEWEVFMELARRVRPEIADKLHFSCEVGVSPALEDGTGKMPILQESTTAIRQEIAQIIPQYAGIQHLKEAGDQFQYGGSHLCFGWNFPTADGKARFAPLSPSQRELPEGCFLVATRRGKQFNSMVQERKDSITGAMREAVLISQVDADQLGLKDGDAVILKNELGELKGRVYIAPIKPGNLQVHWPEGNVLLDKSKRSLEGVPDYNALVRLERQT
jgi:anaerobic selenocysteine-containing dehydrogenase